MRLTASQELPGTDWAVTRPTPRPGMRERESITTEYISKVTNRTVHGFRALQMQLVTTESTKNAAVH